MRFSLVTAVYNVAEYLDAFIESLEAQTFTHDEIEIVAVDDGSTDSSRARLERWAEEGTFSVKVVAKVNGGQGSARNAGLKVAQGEWVTFIDPDDTVNPEYFTLVDTFLRENPTTELVATNRLIHIEATGAITATHPLAKHFLAAAKLYDLDAHADRFFGSVPAAFMRLSVIRSNDLEFDERIRPNFEDGHFVTHYLLLCDKPLVGFLPEAHYHYRKRRAGTSSMQSSLAHPGRFTVVMEHGYLDVLRAGTRAGERYARPWIQTYVLYELSWVFKSEDAIASQSAGTLREHADEFLTHLRALLHYIDPATIKTYAVTGFAAQWRALLLHAFDNEDWHDPFVVVRKVEMAPRRVLLSYRYVGEQPTEEILHRGVPIAPEVPKTRAVNYFGRTLMYERLIWVKAPGQITVKLGGVLVEERARYENARTYTNSAKQMLTLRNRQRGLHTSAEGSPRDRRVERERKLAASAPVRKLFRGAWVLMDRITDADDSAEILFRHLRAHRRGINAWFVVDGDSADYARLKREGYKRIVPYGSLRWRLLMANAAHLISSHVDRAIVAPRELEGLVETPPWRFTFLQHGVIKDDISRWLNHKEIDAFVTSTQAEYDSIVADGSPYMFTAREVVLTELPRFDRLGAIAAELSEREKNLLLIAPTWRQWLAPLLTKGTLGHVASQEFYSTEFAQNWLGLLRSERVAEAAHAAGLKIGFLPHPNMQFMLRDAVLPDHVEPLTYEGGAIQRTFARTRVMVTDHSSTAFNAAYLERPVVYFHFDADKVLQGAHQGRPGYFSYEQDGFGPVVEDLPAAEEALVSLIRDGVPAVYQERLAAAFPFRDGRACRRVTRAIEKLRPMARG